MGHTVCKKSWLCVGKAPQNFAQQGNLTTRQLKTMSADFTPTLVFLKIGALCFGGGYAAVQLAQAETVEHYHWLSMNEFSQMEAIAEMTPGPIALNIASFVGTKLGGWFGAVATTLAIIAVPCLITLILAHLYQKYGNMPAVSAVLNGIKPAVLGMLASVSLSFTLLAMQPLPYSTSAELIKKFNYLAIPAILLAVILLQRRTLGSIGLICLCGSLALIFRLCVGV